MSIPQPILADFDERMRLVAQSVETMLSDMLDVRPGTGEIARPALLIGAMRHAVLGGGKRFRPFLVIETARMFGVEGEGPLRAGSALELLHCYSLVHDDLPAMDDDDMRRGKPTVHKLHDDAMGILVGDALLTLAFDVLADARTSSNAARQAALVSAVARGGGIGGMVGGQLLDLAAEGRYPPDPAHPGGESGVIRIQSMKTGALIKTACRMGAILAGASPTARLALDAYADALGLAFQVKDDLLDVEGDAATIGKAAGKDAAAGKATFISLLGVSGAKQKLGDVTYTGHAALKRFGPKAGMLAGLLDFNLNRKS